MLQPFNKSAAERFAMTKLVGFLKILYLNTHVMISEVSTYGCKSEENPQGVQCNGGIIHFGI